MAIAAFRHPFSAGEVSVPRAASTDGFARGIDMQHDASHLGPIGALRFRIEKAHIGDEVLHVVGRERVCVWGFVSAARIERRTRLRHGLVLVFAIAQTALRKCGEVAAGVKRREHHVMQYAHHHSFIGSETVQ